MLKSTPMPMNSTAKAIEIGLSAVVIHRPSAAVITSPAKVARKTARMIRGERSASHRISSTTATVPRMFATAPSLSVPNSSSWIATSPVSRTRA